MDVATPEALKTTAERIAWAGDNIRTRLVLLEALDKQKAKAKEDIDMYEKMIRKVLKKKVIKRNEL
jgi:hypothetical protein